MLHSCVKCGFLHLVMIMMTIFLKPYEVELATPMHVEPGPLEHCHVTESGRDNFGACVCCTHAFDDLFLLEPKLAAKARVQFSSLELSRGLRTVMTWFRGYTKKPLFRKRILKGASSAQDELNQQELQPPPPNFCLWNSVADIGIITPSLVK